MRLLPAEALLNNTRRLCISPSSGNRPWMGGCHSLLVSSVIRMDRESKQLSTHISLFSTILSSRIENMLRTAFPPSRRQNLKDMNPYLFAVITVRQNLNVMDFHV